MGSLLSHQHLQAMKAQCVMSMMIVILNDATSVNFPLVAEKRKIIRMSATVTATVNQIFAWFPLVLTIETVLIARMTTTAWKDLHAFGARLVLRVRKITAALGGIGMSAQKNAPGSK